MAFFRRTFSRRLLPDRFQEITERVYVFDCCLSTKEMREQDYKPYMDTAVVNLQKHHPGASFMVFNFKEGDEPSLLSDILSDHEMTVVDYPRHYEGYPILPLEMINYFLRSSESWLSLEGQRNVILMHCESGGWPVLAFMLAGLLLYNKKQTGELKTLEMVYKYAPKELLTQLSSTNPRSSQLRYLQYISRRSLISDWPPSDSPLAMKSVLFMNLPLFDGGKGCRPVIHIYGQDPTMRSNRSPRLLFSSLMSERGARYYDKEDCLLVRINIGCRVQGDILLECIHLGEDLVSEEKVFKVMFHTAFVQSYTLVLGSSEVDVLWNANSSALNDFKAEVVFSNPDEVQLSIAKEVTSVGEGHESESEFFEAEEFALSVSQDHSIDNLLSQVGLVVESNVGKEILQANDTLEETHLDHHNEDKQEIIDGTHLDHINDTLMSREVLAIESKDGKETLQASYTIIEEIHLDHHNEDKQEVIDDTHLDHTNEILMSRVGLEVKSNDGKETLPTNYTMEDLHLDHHNEDKQEVIDDIHLDHNNNNLMIREGLLVESDVVKETLQASYTMEDTHLDRHNEENQEIIDDTHLDHTNNNLMSQVGLEVESNDGKETLQAIYTMQDTHLYHHNEEKQEIIDGTHLDPINDNLMSQVGLAIESNDEKETLQANYTMEDTLLDHQNEDKQEIIDGTHLHHTNDNLMSWEGLQVESSAGKETLQANYTMEDTLLDHHNEDKQKNIDDTHLDINDNLMSRVGLEVESNDGKETLQANYTMEDTHLDHHNEDKQEVIDDIHLDHSNDNLMSREGPVVERSVGMETLHPDYTKEGTHLDHHNEASQEKTDASSVKSVAVGDDIRDPDPEASFDDEAETKHTISANVTRGWSSGQALEVVYAPTGHPSDEKDSYRDENISEADGSKIQHTSRRIFEVTYNEEEYVPKQADTEVDLETHDAKNVSIHVDVVTKSQEDSICKSIVVAEEIAEDCSRSVPLEAKKELNNAIKDFFVEESQEDGSKAAPLETGFEPTVVSKIIVVEGGEDEPRVAPLEFGPDPLTVSKNIVVVNEGSEDGSKTSPMEAGFEPNATSKSTVAERSEAELAGPILVSKSIVVTEGSEDGPITVVPDITSETSILSEIIIMLEEGRGIVEATSSKAGLELKSASKNSLTVDENREDSSRAGFESNNEVVEGSDHDSSEISSSEIEPENYLMSRSFMSFGGSEDFSEVASSETGSEHNYQASNIIPVAQRTQEGSSSQAASSETGSELNNTAAKHIVVVVEDSKEHDVKVLVQPKAADIGPRIVQQAKNKKKPRLADAVAKVTMQKRVISMWVPRAKQQTPDDEKNKAPAYKWVPKGPTSTSEES